MLMLLTNN